MKLLQGDCLEIMPTLEAQSFDAIIADIPYGTTACSWDTVIPFAPMWEQLKRLAKPRAAIVLFGSQPFTSALVMSNPSMFRYTWVWDKARPSGFQIAKYRPMMRHEDISVFAKEALNYYPIMEMRERAIRGRVVSRSDSSPIKYNDGLTRTYTHKNPQSIIWIPKENTREHPTQKPVALMEYLIRTYTNEGDTVLDFTMGSGTTMVAAVNTNRNGVGIELREDYYTIAQRRIAEAQAQMNRERKVSND